MIRSTQVTPSRSTVEHEKVREFYDQKYYADAEAQGDSTDWHSRAIANRLGELRGKRVLDIACGTGQWLAELKRLGAIPSGIDISTRAVEQCRSLLPGTDIREGIAERLPFENESFDLVTCMGSLEHFLDQPKALAEMRRVGTAEARFLILVPNAGFLTRRLGFYGGTKQALIRETVRSLGAWQSLMEAAGMKVNQRWRDLHPLSWRWIRSGPAYAYPLRAAQALALAIWPLAWQYQVYFLCEGQD